MNSTIQDLFYLVELQNQPISWLHAPLDYLAAPIGWIAYRNVFSRPKIILDKTLTEMEINLVDIYASSRRDHYGG